DNGETFDTGLYVTTMQLAESNAPLEVYGGSDVNNLTKLGDGDLQIHKDQFDNTAHFLYDASEEAKGKDRYFIQIRFSAEMGDKVRAVKVYRPFTKQSGQLNGLATTMKTARLQSLLVSKRAEAQKMYDEYLKEYGASDKILSFAKSLMQAGCYNTAHELLAGEISQVLPAKYLIKGSANLVRYPISVKLENASDMVQMTLTEVSKDGIAFRFDSEKDQKVVVMFAGLKDCADYALKSLGNNHFELKIAKGGTVHSKNGKITVTANVKKPEKAVYTQVSGRAYSNCSGNTMRVTVQDPAISGYSQYETFMMSANCQYIRYREGDSMGSAMQPRADDYVKLTFDSNNLVCKCEAVYGEKTATIKSFTPPTVAKGGTNGVVEFTDGTKYELENQATTTLITYGELSTRSRNKTAEQLADLFAPGKTITVTYCPESYNGALQRLITVEMP
ncbi:MAG: hypothetical protein MJ132_08770, partial [Clostridia bacterium]|nr:hypothetical protein [Clostridia bacterium]